MRMTCNTHGEVNGFPDSNGHVYCQVCVSEWHRRSQPIPQVVPIEPSTPKRRR